MENTNNKFTEALTRLSTLPLEVSYETVVDWVVESQHSGRPNKSKVPRWLAFLTQWSRSN